MTPRKEHKRKPITQKERTRLLVRARGRCERCDEELDDMVPQIHHVDGNPRNNSPSNLEVLCPNYHSVSPECEARAHPGDCEGARRFNVMSLVPQSFLANQEIVWSVTNPISL
jgi:hypothetical protein